MTGNIVFYCYGGAHSSVVTAAIYLGLLEKAQIPTVAELMLLPYYDRQENQDHGKMRLMGQDQMGNNVYIVGKRNLEGFENLVEGFLTIREISKKPLLVDTLTGVNLFMRIGGFLSRRLKLTAIGRPLVIWGTRKAFKNFVKIADNIAASS